MTRNDLQNCLRCGPGGSLNHVRFRREAIVEQGGDHAGIGIEPEDDQGSPADRSGEVHPLGQGHFRDAPQQVPIGRPPDLGMNARICRQVSEIPPEQRGYQRQGLRTRGPMVAGQGETDGVVSPGAAVSKNVLEVGVREIRPAEESEKVAFGGHAPV